jgi:hypothetical protein
VGVCIGNTPLAKIYLSWPRVISQEIPSPTPDTSGVELRRHYATTRHANAPPCGVKRRQIIDRACFLAFLKSRRGGAVFLAGARTFFSVELFANDRVAKSGSPADRDGCMLRLTDLCFG